MALQKYISLIEANFSTKLELEIRKYVTMFRQFGYNLISTFNFDDLFRIMKDYVNITYCYIALFHPEIPGQSVLIKALHNGKILDLEKQNTIFKSGHFIPPEFYPGERFTLVVEPLFFQKEHLGFMVFNLGVKEGLVYEALQAQISGAIKNISHWQELKTSQKRYQDIANSYADWVWETDQSGQITYCSDGVFNVIGHKSPELLGKSLFSIMKQNEGEVRVSIEEMMTNKRHINNLECVTPSRDNRQAYLLMSAVPITDVKTGRLTGYRGVFKDITFEHDQKEKMSFLAFYDSLTSLPNRRLLLDRMEIALKTAHRNKSLLAVFFIDLDNFKTINDTLGHEVGDQLLVKVAGLLQSSIREVDTVARLGGDEFVILFPRITCQAETSLIAERLVNAFKTSFQLDSHTVQTTPSIGIALYPLHGDNIRILLKNADVAMYTSKRMGKNNYVYFGPDSAQS